MNDVGVSYPRWPNANDLPERPLSIRPDANVRSRKSEDRHHWRPDMTLAYFDLRLNGFDKGRLFQSEQLF